MAKGGKKAPPFVKGGDKAAGDKADKKKAAAKGDKKSAKKSGRFGMEI